MQLLTDDLRQRLPPLYSQDKVQDPILYIKFFTPDSSWTWLFTEGSPQEEDFVFTGYVVGHFPSGVTLPSQNCTKSAGRGVCPLGGISTLSRGR